MFAIEDRELPLVQFELRLKGGLLLEDASDFGAANLLAETMTQGTLEKTPEELEQAIDLLGASIDVFAGRESFSISGTVAVAELFRDDGARRGDPARAALGSDRVRSGQAARSERPPASASRIPTALAEDVFARLLYGDHVLARNPLGDLTSVEALSDSGPPGLLPACIRAAAWRRSTWPARSAWRRSADLAPGHRRPLGRTATSTFPAAPGVVGRSALASIFSTCPNSAQSVLIIGKLALPQTDPEFYPATVMNFRLGGGGFASDLTQLLREQKGYTYGIRSGFSGTDLPGPFRISSSVRSNVTLEVARAGQGHHGATRARLRRGGPRSDQELPPEEQREGLRDARDKIGILRDMSMFGFPADYVLQREAVVRDMSIDRVRELAGRYLRPESMIWLVVGDAATQQGRLRSLGLGTPRIITRDGRVNTTVQ